MEQTGKIVNILDVTLSAINGSYKPYKKPNSNIADVKRASNHPSSILKNIPASIQKRLSCISSTEEEFEGAKEEYQAALKTAGYSKELMYEQRGRTGKPKNRKRQRKIIWYNPPFSKNVATNIGERFFELVRLHFPPQHPFHALFNKKTIKLSYSCMINMDGIVKSHNKAILKKAEDEEKQSERQCNCRIPENCPVGNTCLKSGVVYEALIKHSNGVEQKYVGMTGGSFKTRFNGHMATIRHDKHRTATELSKLVWSLHDRQITYDITWQIIAKAPPYRPGNITCSLCLAEKFAILTRKGLINKKWELLNKCPHRRGHLASLQQTV